jgi:L-cysteine S-thiosulfotransferase
MNSMLLVASALAVSASTLVAGEHDSMSIDSETITIRAAAPAYTPNLDEVVSGWLLRSGETQALELDDFDNPGFILVDKGIDLFNRVEGSAGKSCASCHGNVADFAGLRTQLPRVVDGKLQTMEDIINSQRVNRMRADPLKWSGADMTSLNALITKRAIAGITPGADN